MKPLILLTLASAVLSLGAADIRIKTELDPAEPVGERPYEMVWANRKEPSGPGLPLTFQRLEGWSIKVEGETDAELALSQAQNIWDRPVAKLRYRGSGKSEDKPRILLTPDQPVMMGHDADSVEMWVYGNRWDWENPPDTPPVRILLHLREGVDGPVRPFEADRVRWKEWWLIHKKLPKHQQWPVFLEQIEIAGGWQSEWREIFLDSIHFFRESLPPLQFAPRPRRNLTLFEGQSPGVNTGPGKLPFPTREQTILPPHPANGFRNELVVFGERVALVYTGEDGRVSYEFDAEKGLSGISARFEWGDAPQKIAWNAAVMDGGAVRTPDAPQQAALRNTKLTSDALTAEYADGTILVLRLWQKSLVVDVINRSGNATELSFGQITGVSEPRTVWIPYLTYGGGVHPSVLISRAGKGHVFTSLWLDWYRSNGSEPYAAESASTNSAKINGGVRYHARTDGQRNPMFERLFITVSPVFEEVLPTIPNPPGLRAADAVDRLWQESWGPNDFEKEMKRSRMLRAYGIEKLIQCNHEIAWRDGGESFTLRLRAAPKKGGDEALQNYVAHQRGLGWLAGLYSNYTDYAPVNEFWSPDGVQRQPDGNWRSAWPRCYAEKPVKAVEFDALLAPQIKAKYDPNSAYTDVHTAVSPWGYNDYDARVPGAGTFAQTFYAYGELLRNDSRVYGGPIFSEGTYHWLYAGLADGNYALAYDGRPLAKEPLLPIFDLYEIHTKECDIGMGWTANFCDAIPDWRKAENMDRAIDRFLLNTMAYGHIGWLVEEAHGMDRVCRSYYMLQQVQSRYGLKAPRRIAYWDGTNLVSVSEAVIRDLPRSHRQLMVEYPGGLSLWFNDHATDDWKLPASALGGRRSGRGARTGLAADFERRISDLTLPASGWAAFTSDRQLVSFSALQSSHRVDYLRSGAYTYLNGRGKMFETPEATSDGALAIRPLDDGRLEVIPISGGAFTLRRPYSTRGALAEAHVFDVDGRQLDAPVCQDAGGETRVQPVENGLRYVFRFAQSE